MNTKPTHKGEPNMQKKETNSSRFLFVRMWLLQTQYPEFAYLWLMCLSLAGRIIWKAVEQWWDFFVQMCESLIQKLYNFFFQKRTSLTKYLISLLTRQFTPISNLREFLAYVFQRRESCKNGQLFFLLPFLNPVRETVFHSREKLSFFFVVVL